MILRVNNLVFHQIVSEGRDDGGETKCISREEIPVGRIISRQVFAQKQEENVRNYQNAKTKSTSCLQKPSSNQNQLNVVERACPFARIAVEAQHDALYTRKCFYKLEQTVHWDGGLVQKSTTLYEYFTKVNKAVDADCSGISQDRRQATKDFLPDVIQLGRSELYSFVFYLYLDYDFQVGELSISISLFAFLLVSYDNHRKLNNNNRSILKSKGANVPCYKIEINPNTVHTVLTYKYLSYVKLVKGIKYLFMKQCLKRSVRIRRRV